MNGKSKSSRPRHNRRYLARRLDILRSAASAFSRKGFSAATMEEIADQLNLTKGSLYYYFGSKQDLLYFCQDYSLRRLLEEAEAIVRSERPVARQLYDLIRAQLRCMLDEMGGSSAHLEFRDLPEPQLREIVAKRDRYERVVRRLVRRGMKEGVFFPGDPRSVVWAILGALNWTAQWYSPAGEYSVEEIGHQFGVLFLRGLLRPEHWNDFLLDLEGRRTGQEKPFVEGTVQGVVGLSAPKS